MKKIFLAKKLDQSPLVYERKNIFDQESFPNNTKPNNYKLRFNIDGEIIPYSIIGKPEWFNRSHTSKNQPIEEENQFSPSLVSSRRGTIISRFNNSTSKKHKVSNVQLPEMPKFKITFKEKLIQDMKQLKHNQQIRNKINCNVINQLKIDTRNYITREQRVIENFDKRQKQWEDTTYSLGSKVGRNPKDVLQNRSVEYRKRVEKIQALESVQTDIERLSHRYWYITLRNYTPQYKKSKKVIQQQKISRHIIDEENEKFNESNQLSDIFSGFNSKITYNPNRQIEVIRQPRFQQTHLYSNSFGSSFHEKLQCLQPELTKKMVQANDSEIGELVVEGNSVYDQELYNLIQDNEPKHKPYMLFEQQNDETECIEETWDQKQLGKTGQYQYRKVWQLLQSN